LKYPLNSGSLWGVWDLQVQTILDDAYIELRSYYAELKVADAAKWRSYVDKVGGEENALKFDSKLYFNDTTVDKKQRCYDYTWNLFAYLETYQPWVRCIGVTDHNYGDEILLDALIACSQKTLPKVIGGVEINIGGTHMLVFFPDAVFAQPNFSQGIKTFLTKIGVHTKKSNGVLTVCGMGPTEVINVIKSQHGILIYPHCNSDNGLGS